MLLVENLTVRSGEFILSDVALKVPKGQCGVVVGPSGAGKSTLLEAIAGLREIVNGRITLNGRDLTSLPPERRSIAFVPQDYALFPHMTVRGNILLAPRLLRLPKGEVEWRFFSLCELLDLKDLLHLRPHQLSGGERQRVALARALILRPQLLLLDEPFAALDPQMRPTVRRSLRKVLQTLNTTVLIVTHDLWDAAALGDCVFVIENGRIVQSGSWAEVIADPKSDFIAEFIGINRFIGVIARDGDRTYLQTEEARLPVQTDLPDGTPARLQFFPSQVQFVPNDRTGAWRGVVAEAMDLGDRLQLVVELPNGLIVRAEVPSTCPYTIGDAVAFVVTVAPTLTESVPTPAAKDAADR